MKHFTMNDVVRLSTLTHDEIRGAFARSGEYIEHFDILYLRFVDFYVNHKGELTAHYTSTLRTPGEVTDDAQLYISLTENGYEGSF